MPPCNNLEELELVFDKTFPASTRSILCPNLANLQAIAKPLIPPPTMPIFTN